MKMDMTAKPEGEGLGKTNDGEYSQEQLADMLDDFICAKKIEADPKLFNLVKEYAMSKNKMVEELFATPSKTSAPKSLKDLKTKYDESVREED